MDIVLIAGMWLDGSAWQAVVPELAEIGPEAVDGHLSSSVYFASIPTARRWSIVSRAPLMLATNETPQESCSNRGS